VARAGHGEGIPEQTSELRAGREIVISEMIGEFRISQRAREAFSRRPLKAVGDGAPLIRFQARFTAGYRRRVGIQPALPVRMRQQKTGMRARHASYSKARLVKSGLQKTTTTAAEFSLDLRFASDRHGPMRFRLAREAAESSPIRKGYACRHGFSGRD